MPISYVDEIVVRYLMKKGYLISQGIWFPLSKEKTGKKGSGWSDIDILAIKPNEPTLVIQCKSFLGRKKSEEVAKDITKWFENAIDFLEKDPNYSKWVNRENHRKILVVDSSVKKTEKLLKEKGVKVWHYEDKLKELLMILKKGRDEGEKHGRIGKEEDLLLKTLSSMYGYRMIAKEVFETEKIEQNL